jgi:hypothetical protein
VSVIYDLSMVNNKSTAQHHIYGVGNVSGHYKRWNYRYEMLGRTVRWVLRWCRACGRFTVRFIINNRRTLTLYSCRDQYPEYFRSSTEVDFYFKAMTYLGTQLAVWPPVEELVRASRKMNVIQDLDFVAREVTRTIRPVTNLLSDAPSIERETFLKREGSDCARHVYNPRRAAEISPEKLSLMVSVYDYRWIKQQYVPELATVGEWRIIIINRRILHVINTTYRQLDRKPFAMEASIRTDGYSLEEMA